MNSNFNEIDNKIIGNKYIDFEAAMNIKNINNINDFENINQIYYYKLLNYKNFNNLNYGMQIHSKDKYELSFTNKNNYKLKINIYKGTIESANTNIVIDTLNKSLVLGGGVAGALNIAAGNQLQLELNDIKNYMIDYYDKDYKGLCITNTYKMNNVNKIYHIVGPNYNELSANNDQEKIKIFENKIFQITLFTLDIFNTIGLKNNNNTITFPTISTGIYFNTNKPIDIPLRPFIMAFFTYYNFHYDNTKIIDNSKSINIVIYKDDSRSELDTLNNIINELIRKFKNQNVSTINSEENLNLSSANKTKMPSFSFK